MTILSTTNKFSIMANYSIKADLLKIKGAAMINLKGKTATKRKNIPILGGMHEIETQVRKMPVTQTIEVLTAYENPTKSKQSDQRVFRDRGREGLFLRAFGKRNIRWDMQKMVDVNEKLVKE